MQCWKVFYDKTQPRSKLLTSSKRPTVQCSGAPTWIRERSTSEQQGQFLWTQLCALRTPDPRRHMRKLKKPSFKQTSYLPLALKIVTQRQQQPLISYIHDQWLHSVNSDVCWGSRAHANGGVLNILQECYNWKGTTKSHTVNIFALLLHFLTFLLQMLLSFLQSLLNEEAKHVCERVHSQESLGKS